LQESYDEPKERNIPAPRFPNSLDTSDGAMLRYLEPFVILKREDRKRDDI
jgi:hypothetical protein